VPRATVHAVEADPLARSWAERNITRYVDSYTAGRVLLHTGDFVSGGDSLAELAGLAGTVDLVVSNPPYIPIGSVVAPEAAEYDPPAALWSGRDGLDAIRAVERVARWLLRPDGLVAVEHSDLQGAAVYWVFSEEAGWRDARNHKDLTGRDRFVTASWAGG
jgi:release factor glutamine methyltransferase